MIKKNIYTTLFPSDYFLFTVFSRVKVTTFFPENWENPIHYF